MKVTDKLLHDVVVVNPHIFYVWIMNSILASEEVTAFTPSRAPWRELPPSPRTPPPAPPV